MITFYETVVIYDKITETGDNAEVKEQFLIDALSCTEAESRTIKEVEAFVKGQVRVTSVKVSKYTEFVEYSILHDTNRLLSAENSADEVIKNNKPDNITHYAVKVNYIITKENGKVKKNPEYFIVAAVGIEHANDTINQYLKDSMESLEVASIQETKIVDVIMYDLRAGSKDM